MFIYKLLFSDGSIYVGKTTKSLKSRLMGHCAKLRSGKHHSHKMQKKYTEVGLPEIHVLEETTLDLLDIREIYWIDKLDSYYSGLNCTKGGELTLFGEDNIAAKYKNDDYKAVVICLAYTDWSIKEIAQQLDVGYEMIKHIYAGRTNTHLAKEIPEAYTLMCKKRNRVLKVKDPAGIIHEVLPTPYKFTQKHSLNSGRFNHLLNKKITSYKGWTLVQQ